jgi:hypothetical protein
VNAVEFVPSFGSEFSFAPKPPTVPQPVVSKPSPSTSVVNRNTTEDERKQTEPVIKTNELNVQQQVQVGMQKILRQIWIWHQTFGIWIWIWTCLLCLDLDSDLDLYAMFGFGFGFVRHVRIWICSSDLGHRFGFVF